MILILIAIITGSVFLDQLTKWLAVVYLQGEPSFPLWRDVLHFTFVKNEGAAFIREMLGIESQKLTNG